MSSQPDHSYLRVDRSPDIVHVRLTGCRLLNEETTPIVKEQLVRLADELGAAKVTLDMREVMFLTSTGLGMLVAIHKKVQSLGGHLSLCGMLPEVRELFEVTQLNRILDLEPDGMV